MRALLAVASLTFRECVRDRVLHGLVGAGLAAVLAALAVAELSLDQQERVVADLGLAAVSLLAVATAVVLGSSLLAQELDRRTLYLILPRPLWRWQFLLGKYLGIVTTGAMSVATTGGALLLVAALQRDLAPSWALAALALVELAAVLVALLARDRVRWLPPLTVLWVTLTAALAARQGVPLAPYGAALLLIVGEVALLTAVALFFSSFSTPMTSGALTVGAWLLGRSAGTMAELPRGLVGPQIKALMARLARIVPNFQLFAPGYARLEQRGPLGDAFGYVATVWAYGMLYAALLLAAAALVFSRRDLP